MWVEMDVKVHFFILIFWFWYVIELDSPVFVVGCIPRSLNSFMRQLSLSYTYILI